MATDSTLKARARLFLRSEQALGQNFLPLRPLRPRRPAPTRNTPIKSLPPSSPPPLAASPHRPLAASPIRPDPKSPDPKSLDIFIEPTSNPAALPPLSREQKTKLLAELEEQQVRNCPKCRLAKTRTQTVFGEGDVDAPIFFIGEGPGETEDQTGRPFVGRAGQLLDKMIVGMGLKREQVYIANIVKCRPPENRTPAPDEVETCSPYLVRQLEIIRPKVIVTLGLPAAKFMLNANISMGRLRGQWHEWRGIRLMPTFHPAYLLRSYTVENRQAVWSDLQKVMNEIGLKSPTRKVEEPA